MSKNSEKKKISTSPDRHSFGKLRTQKSENSGEWLDFYEKIINQEAEQIHDPEWQKNNLEYDLRSTEWICEKVRSDSSYAQNLYAALCNNDFQKLDILPILKEETWSCSWRYAGGIVAHMRREGDYIDWYLSGINNDYDEDYRLIQRRYVPEGTVTDEIRTDLKILGWAVIDGDN
jgi:hypothetical protein